MSGQRASPAWWRNPSEPCRADQCHPGSLTPVPPGQGLRSDRRLRSGTCGSACRHGGRPPISRGLGQHHGGGQVGFLSGRGHRHPSRVACCVGADALWLLGCPRPVGAGVIQSWYHLDVDLVEIPFRYVVCVFCCG